MTEEGRQAPSLASFRALVREFELAAARIEAEDRVPPDLLERARAAGLFGLTLPEEYGGAGMDASAAVPYLEAAGMGPGACRMLTHVANGIWRPIRRYGSAEQKALLGRMAAGETIVAFALTEASAGSGRDLASRAVRDGDRWLLSGEKHLITFAGIADHFLLTVAADDRRAPDSLVAFLIPRAAEGLRIEASQHMMGLAGTAHGRLRFDAMAIDDRHRLGEVGQGLQVAMSFLDYSRVSLAATMVGLAARALDEAIAYARRRVTFGRALTERQAIQMHIGEMGTRIRAADALVRAAARRFDEGRLHPGHASATKLFCQEVVTRVTDLALAMHGGTGYTRDAAIERIYRDARGYWFEEGTSEIQQMVVARGLIDGPGACDELMEVPGR